MCPYDTFSTGTEPLFLAVGNNRQFAILCGMIGRPDLPDDARFASNSDRNVNRDALKTELEAALAAFDCDSLADRLLKAGVPCGAVRTIDQVVADPHTRHRGMVVDIGAYRGTGSPIKMSRTPASYRLAPPQFAQHTDEVLGELGLDSAHFGAVLPGTSSGGK
ncbi:CoA transferase [Rhizobiaceae sp. 2RAB30]